MAAVAQVFQAGVLLCGFVVADDERVVRAFLVGFAQLVFQRLHLGLYDDADVRVAQVLYQRQQGGEVGVVGGDGIDSNGLFAEGGACLCQ